MIPLPVILSLLKAHESVRQGLSIKLHLEANCKNSQLQGQGTVHKTTLTSNTNYKFRAFLKPPSDSITHWKVSVPTKSCYIHSHGLLGGKIEVKISHEKKCMGYHPEGFYMWTFQLSLLINSKIALMAPGHDMCQYIWTNDKHGSIPEPQCPKFYWNPIT